MKQIFLIFLVSGLFISLQAQKDVILTVGKEKISKTEFERVYKKNNSNAKVDQKSLEEYMELYINFRLKVYEAKSQGLDTMMSFKNELGTYRDQLAKPYLTDKRMDSALIKEAYTRMQSEVRTRHIIIKLDENAAPEDTLKVYNKLMEARKKLIAGAPFDSVAPKYTEDPYFDRFKGDLGYITAFNVVYPYETVAYNTPVGTVTNPIRTKFGYHLIEVMDKRPSRGTIRAAHIMIAVPQGSDQAIADSAKRIIFTLHEKLKQGADFATLANEYSTDRMSAEKGGDLDWFTTNKMVAEFENAAFSLQKNGDITEPVKTNYGWHIIKRTDYKGLPAFEQIKDDLAKRIQKDERAFKGQDLVIMRAKNDYKFKEVPKNLEAILPIFDSTVFKGSYVAPKTQKLNKPLFVIDKKKYTQKDFALFVEDDDYKGQPINMKVYIDKKYKAFVDIAALDAEKKHLEEKYSDFRNLVQEYHDGILLFNITDKLVWSKAVKDTSGLQKFHQGIKGKFMWKQRADVKLYSCNSKDTAEKVLNTLKANPALPDSFMLEKICGSKDSKCIIISSGLYEKGDNAMVDQFEWIAGKLAVAEKDAKHIVLSYQSIKDPQSKELREVKGLVTAEYQNHLEEIWIKELRSKYPYTVNKELVNSIK